MRLDVVRAGGFIEYLLYDPNDQDSTCRNSHFYCLLTLIYALLTALYIIAAIILDQRIAFWSSQGSPTEREPRSSKVAHLLELKLLPVTIVLLLVWATGLSTISTGKRYYRCVYESELAHDPTSTPVVYWWVPLVILLSLQFTEMLFSWRFLFGLCRQPRVINSASWHGDEEAYLTDPVNHELIEEMWAERCASFCQCLSWMSCFLFGGRELAGQAEFGDVARALADYLEYRGVLDVVPSDIVTGLILVRNIQQERILNYRRELRSKATSTLSTASTPEGRTYTTETGEDSGLLGSDTVSPINLPAAISSTQPLMDEIDPLDPADRNGRLLDRNSFSDMQCLEEGARYASYALAIYTWVLYVYERPISGPFELLGRGCIACCRGKYKRAHSPDGLNISGENEIVEIGEAEFHGDNMCRTHRNALLLSANLSDADLVYAQLRSGFRDNPYCIILDHAWKTVVVSIRGTFSLEDCVTDVLIQPESLEKLGVDFGFNGHGQFCHGGVMNCVRNIYRDLERHHLLERLLLGPNAAYPDYSLRIVGHSLGAATGTLLSYMLRNKYPNLRCLNYSPVGCAFTWDLATGCSEWCDSFFVDSDIVPRLSLESMDKLRDDMLEGIGRLKVPKIHVARRAVGHYGLLACGDFCYRFFSDEHALQDTAELLHEPENVPDSAFQDQLSRFKLMQAERKRSRGVIRSTKLYPPGRMIHLAKIGEKRSCLHGCARCLTCCSTSFGSEYVPVWVRNDELHEIVVSPTMGTDHFPNRLRKILVDVASSHGMNAS
ncbi:sn1-specific diacylglycerol lipase [Fistulifera solaris]|uniref:sn-1-specific diacylglycerol lipase n=1 Tax=Fistulifera solaris TaxID=1519565 RepID=A0A1Z5JZF0_FISSO|nr:sn1-specific diacylglycerol lipase [Fistulifera solaris]|eukprot:GAX19394.1 sn1-specific diacylglycerol lipase [Fistulifera solaris]